MTLYLYDDARARQFEPFALTRPIGELRVGALVTRARWELITGDRAAGHIVAPHLLDFEEPGAPGAAGTEIPAGALVINSRCIPSLGANLRGASVVYCDGRVAAVRLSRALSLRDVSDTALAFDKMASATGAALTIKGRWLDEVWHIIRDLQVQLTDDLVALIPAGKQYHIEDGARVDPMVSVDCANGPVLVRRGAVVQAFTRLIGPCYIGEDSTVTTDRIEGSAIGEHCKVHGELSASVVHGYANKSHDGFVGHSYLGRWVNLGAGTITSNLKNTYGSIHLWTPEGQRDTGLTFLGTLFGDYARTGIGTRLTTGAVIGAGANVVSSGVTPKYIPPFAWDEHRLAGSFALDKFYAVAERQMKRRGLTLDARARRQLAAAHARSSRS